jgi:hypothetical protein
VLVKYNESIIIIIIILIKLGKATPLPEHLWKGNSPYGTPGERQLPFRRTWVHPHDLEGFELAK